MTTDTLIPSHLIPAKPTYWIGKITDCDICENPIKSTFIDGRTRGGPWGIMCGPCHADNGVGLGVGRGQRYRKDETGRFAKVVAKVAEHIHR